MANTKNFIAKNGVSTGDGYSMPDIRPSLLLDFANSKTLDPRITFTRGSTATYWDGHTTAKAEENLVSYSQGGGNITGQSITFTENDATAPDGTTTATKVIYNGSTNGYAYKIFQPLTPDVPYTFSTYVKYGNVDNIIVGFVIQNVLAGGATFTFSTQAFSGVSGGVSTSYSNVGDGWYRIMLTYTPTAAGSSANFIKVAAATTAWTTGSYAFTWGAQVEQRSSVTAYTATTSNPIVKYQPTLRTAASGEARFDHDPVTGESKGLLIEESRTNLFPQSASDANFTYTNEVTLTDDFAIAPDGTQNAFLVQASTTSAQHYFGIPQGNGSTSGTDTFSIHLKSYGVPNVTLILANQPGSYSLVVDLDAGTITTSGSANVNESMEDVGNGWYRISMSWTATKSTPYPTIRLLDSSDASTWAGDGFSGVLVWGAQWEAGAFPTSYIPTSGSTVTRSGEACYSLDSAFTPSGTFTALAKASLPYDNTVANINASMFAFGPDRIQLRYDDGVGAQFLVYNPSAVVDINAGTPSVNSGMTAVQIGQNDFKFSSAGSTVQTDSGGIFDVPETMYIGNLSNSSEYLNGHIQKIAFYTASLSNATLQQMTEE